MEWILYLISLDDFYFLKLIHLIKYITKQIKHNLKILMKIGNHKNII